MTIEIRDAALAGQRFESDSATGSSGVEEVRLRLLDTHEEPDR